MSFRWLEQKGQQSLFGGSIKRSHWWVRPCFIAYTTALCSICLQICCFGLISRVIIKSKEKLENTFNVAFLRWWEVNLRFLAYQYKVHSYATALLQWRELQKLKKWPTRRSKHLCLKTADCSNLCRIWPTHPRTCEHLIQEDSQNGQAQQF